MRSATHSNLWAWQRAQENWFSARGVWTPVCSPHGARLPARKLMEQYRGVLAEQTTSNSTWLCCIYQCLGSFQKDFKTIGWASGQCSWFLIDFFSLSLSRGGAAEGASDKEPRSVRFSQECIRNHEGEDYKSGPRLMHCPRQQLWTFNKTFFEQVFGILVGSDLQFSLPK